MSADKHEITYAYPVRMGKLWVELVRMDDVGLALPARMS